MSSFTDTLEDNILNHYFRNVASIAVATNYMSLHTVAPTDSTIGTEVTGGGYARKSIAFNAPSGGSITNNGVVTWTASGANYGTVNSIGIWIALSGGTITSLLAYDGITDAVVNDGDTISFADAGGVTITVT